MSDGITDAWRASEEYIRKRDAGEIKPTPTVNSLLDEKQDFLNAFKRIVESEDAKDMYDIALDMCNKYNVEVNTNL